MAVIQIKSAYFSCEIVVKAVKSVLQKYEGENCFSKRDRNSPEITKTIILIFPYIIMQSLKK